MTTTYSGATIELKLERLAAEGKIDKEYIGTLLGNDLDQNLYTKRFPITWDAAEPGGVTGEVAANAPSSTVFKTDLSSAVEDYYKDMTLRFTSGARDGEMRVITAYAQATKQITVAPALSGAPSVTDTFIVEPSVDVFTDDGTPGSWTEYDEDGTDYVIDATTGKVTIKAAENAGGNAGERISISYYTSEEPAVGQDVSIEFSQPLTEIYKLGSTDPQELKEGNISIGGTIGLIWADRSMIGTFLGVKDFYKKLSDYSFYLYPNKDVSGQPYIKLSNVKFSGGTLGTDIGGPVALSVAFKGLAIESGTLP